LPKPSCKLSEAIEKKVTIAGARRAQMARRTGDSYVRTAISVRCEAAL
jgi:hypothetical protein